LRATLLAKPGSAALREHAAELVAAVRVATRAAGGAKDRDVVASIVRGVTATERRIRASRPKVTARPKPAASLAAASPTAKPGAVTPATDPTGTALRARAVIEPLGHLGDAADHIATAKAWWAELRLGPALDRIFREAGDPATPSPIDASAVVHRTWLLLGLPRPGSVGGLNAKARALGVAKAWLADPDTAAVLGVHEADGERWLVAENLETVIAWATTLDTIEAVGGPSSQDVAPVLSRAAQAAGYRVESWLDRLGRLDGSGRAKATAPTGRRVASASPQRTEKRARPPRKG
jgi:hypothetical protein